MINLIYNTKGSLSFELFGLIVYIYKRLKASLRTWAGLSRFEEAENSIM